jgi:hypothetical protein
MPPARLSLHGQTTRSYFQPAWRPLIALLAVTVAGCGYHHQELFPTQVRTISVPIFQNRTFYQGVEFDLTEALIKEIQLRTPYKVVPPELADTVLLGAVVAVDQRLLSVTRRGGLPQEMEARITVDFEWKNARDATILADRKGFGAIGRYIPAKPVGETFATAQHQAVQQLAGDIVSAMRADW